MPSQVKFHLIGRNTIRYDTSKAPAPEMQNLGKGGKMYQNPAENAS